MNKMQQILTTMFLAGCSAYGFAQSNGKIAGMVGSNKKPLEAVTVSVLKTTDSSLVKTAVTDKAGHFTVNNLPAGKYLVVASSVNYQKKYSAAFEIKAETTSLELPAIELTEGGKDLGSVTVTVKKPFIEQKMDRTIVNVDAVASNTGLTVLEVLEKSPGISVDKDGNISLKGKQGVMILIDGKPSYLGGQDLVNLLKSMPSNQLETMELMTNPPAKYDAAGNSGIINLKTKKSKTRGYNGSINIGYGQGVYPKANSGANMNYRNGKWNLFGNYAYNFNKNFQDIAMIRNFRDLNSLALLSAFEQKSFQLRKNNFQSLKFGADFYASKKTTVGFVLNGFTNPGTEQNNTDADIYNGQHLLETRNAGYNYTKRKMDNISGNVNVRHQFDSAGTELTADVDYVRYTTKNNQQFDNYFYDKNGLKKQPDEILKSSLPQDINIFSAKTDFTKPINKTTKIEAGLKTSIVKTDNNALYQNLLNNNWETDLGRTNHFIYKENINAAYVNMSKDLTKKWSAQLGLRLENTISNGEQVTTGIKFKRNYTQLFPTVYVGYHASEKNEFVINFGRRIQRPNYEDLNPFYNFLDKYTYQVGNPNLKPQFTNAIELSHTYNNVLTTTLNYSETKDILTEIVEQIDSTSTTFVRKDNIASQKNLGLSMNLGMPVTKWLRTNIFANVHYDQYKGIINQQFTSVSATSLEMNMSSQFTFKKGWGGDINGWFQTAGVRGVLGYKAQGTFNLGISKQILKTMGTLKLTVRDPLYLQQFHGYSKYQNVDMDFRSKRDSRGVNISFAYRFGKPLKNVKQRKTGGAGDEQNRVGGGN